MNEAWMDDIDKITERKELPIVLRKHGFNTTADEYIEMCGALKLYIAQKLEARKGSYRHYSIRPRLGRNRRQVS